MIAQVESMENSFEKSKKRFQRFEITETQFKTDVQKVRMKTTYLRLPLEYLLIK